MKKLHKIALATMLGVLAQSSIAQQSTISSAQKSIAGLFGKSNEDELIEPDLAFRLKVSAKGPNTVIAELLPAKGYYLYKEKVRVVPAKDSGVTVTGLKFPQGEMKTDQIYGRTEVFKVAAPVEVTLKRPPSVKNVNLTVSYQGCHEKLGVCYPPIDKTVSVALP